MKHLLLLHGALGSKEQLAPLQENLFTDYKVDAINFSGHGGEEPKAAYSIQFFAEEVKHWVQQNNLSGLDIFGYSMGGYVALYLARYFPELVNKVVTLGTKFLWDEAIATKEAAMLNPEIILQKVPKFADELAERHHPADWKNVVKNTAAMMLQMGKEVPLKANDFTAINAKVLLLLGDRDKMVTLDETVNVFKLLPQAEFGVLPGTPHPMEGVDKTLLADLIRKYLQ